MDPAAYPPTDDAEHDAVSILNRIINAKRVKTHIETRDKVPNTDGCIELVDENFVPLGKIEVQVKKIPDDSLKYGQCSSGLVSYSLAITSPFIFIGADVKQEKAFWKQLYPTMPEYKEGQKTFTINFDPDYDEISQSDEKYFAAWLRIIQDYQARIHHSPIPSTPEEASKELGKISPQDRAYFQDYVDHLNHLLDYEFICVKEIILPGVWKLGVGLYHSTNDEKVEYEI